MKIILLEEVAGVGQKHDVKEVSGGYARNFLFPKQLAKPATPRAERALETLKKRLAAQEAEGRHQLEALGREIGGRSLEFALKSDGKGAAYGSVTKEMILRAMREHNWLGKERADVALERPLKEFGEHAVEVDLKKGVKANLRVILRPQT